MIVLLLLPLIAAAHFIIFPQETRCILIRFSQFKKQRNIYCRQEVPAGTVEQLIGLASAAEKKVCRFWQSDDCTDYSLIYCASNADYNNYGREGAPAVTNLKMGAYVVIPQNMFDTNIISHEISHTVLYRKIGWWRLHYKILAWFDEGLAMQVDDRDYYSFDSLLYKKASGMLLPDVMQLDTPEKFHQGSNEQVMLNYATAKYVVHEWLLQHSLENFIKSINNGYSFRKSYAVK
jgi:hypothetical protein